MRFNYSCISAFLEQVGPQIPSSQPSVVGEKVVVLLNPREDFSWLGFSRKHGLDKLPSYSFMCLCVGFLKNLFTYLERVDSKETWSRCNDAYLKFSIASGIMLCRFFRDCPIFFSMEDSKKIGFSNILCILLSCCRSDSSSDSEHETSNHSKRHKKNDKPKKVVIELLFLLLLLHPLLVFLSRFISLHFLEQGKGPKQESSS